MKVYVFEDGKAKDFFPLTMTRPVYDLRSGTTTLLEKLMDAIRGDYVLHTRDYLAEVTAEAHPGVPVNAPVEAEDALFVNGRWLYRGDAVELGDEHAAYAGGQLVYAYAKASTMEKLKGLSVPEALERLKAELGSQEVDARLAEWPWDLVFANPEMIEYDFKRLGKTGVHGEVKGDVEILGGEDRVYIAPGAKVYPGVVIDAEGGPVYIGEGARIYPFSFIEGPSSIGPGTYIMTGAKIREGVTAGPVVRMGGEVEESVVHGYSNKYHDGFLGHAYVGEWVSTHHEQRPKERLQRGRRIHQREAREVRLNKGGQHHRRPHQDEHRDTPQHGRRDRRHVQRPLHRPLAEVHTQLHLVPQREAKQGQRAPPHAPHRRDRDEQEGQEAHRGPEEALQVPLRDDQGGEGVLHTAIRKKV